MKHIIAAIDFSDLTDALVDQSMELAKAFSARLTLLHAAAEDPEFIGYEVGPQSVRDARADTLRSEHRDLEDRVRILHESGVEADFKLVMGPAIETIIEQVTSSQADLVVIGSHGHGTLYQVLVGSVAEGVLRHSTCPVLVVPASKSEE